MSDNIEKLTPFLWKRGSHYLHWCPGCAKGHAIPVPNWEFNGNVDAPSFSPSIKISTPPRGTDTKHEPETVQCHYFLTDGIILFQPDSGHMLKHGAFPLQAIPEDYGF